MHVPLCMQIRVWVHVQKSKASLTPKQKRRKCPSSIQFLTSSSSSSCSVACVACDSSPADACMYACMYASVCCVREDIGSALYSSVGMQAHDMAVGDWVDTVTYVLVYLCFKYMHVVCICVWRRVESRA